MLREEVVYGRIRTRRRTALAELEPAPRDLHVHVRLGPAGEALQHVVLADRILDRPVHVVVPACRGLFERHRAALLEAHEVSVAEDVLEDLVIAAEAAALQPRLRARAVQLSRLE